MQIVMDFLNTHIWIKFIVLSIFLFSGLLFIFFVLPKYCKIGVKGIDSVFGGDKPPALYNYKENELVEIPEHWKHWEKN